MGDADNKLVFFKGNKIRRLIYQNEWWFSVVDVCSVLVESTDAGAYWRKLKQRLLAEGSEVVTFCHGLKLVASDGKKYATDCANTEGMLRIVQTIPSSELIIRKEENLKLPPDKGDKVRSSLGVRSGMQDSTPFFFL